VPKMSTIEKAFSAEDFRKYGHELIDLLANHLENVSEEKTFPHQAPNEALDFWESDFKKPLSENPNDVFSEILNKSVKLHHPHYMGHQVTPPAPLAALAGAFTGFVNNGMALYEMGMAATPIERIVTDFIAQKIGYEPNGNGFLTSGGTIATLTAILAARAAKSKTDVWQNGTEQKLAIMVSEEAHYCADRAARVMGLGSDGIIKVPANEHFQMRIDTLEVLFADAQQRGIEVFCVVASACTTSTGSYDDLTAVADFCKKHQLWLHVDGAHGGAVVFSEKYNHLVKGIEQADSVIIDLHKMLMLPALATAVLFKNPSDGYHTFQQKAHYLWSNQNAEDWFNVGKRSFECTKLMMGVKAYLLLRTYGEQLWQENIDTLHDLAQNFAELITKNPAFELAVWPQSNIVCFRHIGKSENLNEHNTQIRQRLLEKGDFYIVQTNLRGQFYLRVSLMNPRTQTTDLVDLLKEIEALA